MLQQCGMEMVVKGEEEEVMVEMGDFFDNFDSLLDFPMEDIEVDTEQQPAEPEQEQEHDAKRMRLGGAGAAGNGGFFNPPPPALAADDSFNPDTVWPTESDLNPAGLHLPYEDFPPLEWMSSFMEDPFASGTVVLGNDNAQQVDKKTSIHRGNDNTVMPNNYQRFQSSSPVSVLETSSSNSVAEKAILLNAENVPRGRARSKRPRPATFTPRPVVQFMSPATSSITDTTATSELLSEVEDYVESHLTKKMYELNDPTEKKKKISKKKKQPPKRKLPPLPGAKEQPPRKCLHCEITKTPQWRAGPMGPKTLCNACGVRYKSGRLFPEYRPAASPTFVPAKHSNSHRKVLEMRVRCGDEMGSASTMATSEPSNNQLVDLDVTRF